MRIGREEDMEELSLDLSIGGKYGKAEDLKEKTSSTEFCGGRGADCEGRSGFVASRCDFPGVEAVDPWRRREIQALRRQEARRKREEKVRKSRGANGVGFVEDKLFLEAQRFQARARDREIREKDCFFEGKNRENGSDEGGDELGISLFSEKKEREKECLYPKVQFASPLIECDSEYSNGVKSLDQCSSAVSDYHSISQKGESSSDAGSHLSPMHRGHVDRVESHNSSSQAETDWCVGPAKVAPSPTSNPQPTWMRSAEGSNVDNSPSPSPGGGVTNVSSTTEKETSGGLNDNNPTKPSNHDLNAACLPRMPCVSATGNGPNGRTVTGFLYQYNKTEVSIMCVCHGSSFSPAGFVEHAGGLDVAHPLRHITVVPFGPPVGR